jgi:hypothetical protein
LPATARSVAVGCATALEDVRRLSWRSTIAMVTLLCSPHRPALPFDLTVRRVQRTRIIPMG